MTKRRLLPALTGFVALFLGAASIAPAAVALRFSRARAVVGVTVTATAPGFPGARSVVVYLVPTELPGVKPDPAGSYILRHVPTKHVFKLGTLRYATYRDVQIRFRVPAVPPGDYTTAFWCSTCLKGGDFFASAAWGATSTSAPGRVLRVTR